MKVRRAFLLALPIAGLAGCATTPSTPLLSQMSTTTTVGAPPTTKAPTTTTIKVTTARAPKTTAVTQYEEVAVVSIAKTNPYMMDVRFSATNHSSKTSDYTFKYVCYVKGVQVGAWPGQILAVAPGETVFSDDACLTSDAVDEVRIVSVERDATTGRSD
jgi:hypothetical protein